METGEKNNMSHFITFEGIDGSGKSTIAQHVYEQLKKEDHKVGGDVVVYSIKDAFRQNRVSCNGSDAA